MSRKQKFGIEEKTEIVSSTGLQCVGSGEVLGEQVAVE